MDWFFYIRLIFSILPCYISLYAIFIAYRQRSCREQLVFILIMANIFLVSLGGLFELLSYTAESALNAKKLSYLGRILCTLIAPEFIGMYVHYYISKHFKRIIWITNAIFILVIFTTDYTRFFYARYWVENINGSPKFFCAHGPLYSFFCIQLSSLFFLITIGVFRSFVKCRFAEEKKRLAVLLAGTLSPLVAVCLFMLKLTNGWDLVPLSMNCCAICYLIPLKKYHLFDIEQHAKDLVLESSNEAIMVLDNVYRVLYLNEQILSMDPSIQLHEVLPDYILESVKRKDTELHLHEHSYNIVQTPLYRDNSSLAGILIEICDVTEQLHTLFELDQLRLDAEQANKAKSAFLSNMSHEIRTPMNAIVGMTEILLRENVPPQPRAYLNNIRNSGNALLTIINDILDFSKMESGKLEIIEDDYDFLTMINDLSMIFLNRIGEKPITLIYDIDKNIPKTLHGDSQRLRQIFINIMNNAIKFTDQGMVKLHISVLEQTDDEILLSASVIDSGIGIKEEDLPKLFGTFQQLDTKTNYSKEGTGLGLAISKQLIELMGGSIQVNSIYGAGSEFSFTVRQKVSVSTPAAIIKKDTSKLVFTCCFTDPLYTEQIEQLCKMYDLCYLPFHQVTPTDKIDYLFSDAKHISYLKQNCDPDLFQIYILQNPMLPKISDPDLHFIDLPIYSRNFCQLINDEFDVTDNNLSDNYMNFTAPDARILLVDDTPINLTVAIGLMRPLNLQIDTAENGRVAIEKIQTNHYDLVFMDHKMPVMDGIEATLCIRDKAEDYYQDLPIIALSANAVFEVREEFKEAGMNGFIAKPIDMKDLCHELKKWLPAELILPRSATDPQNASEPPKSLFEDLNDPTPPEDSASALLISKIKGIDYQEGLKNSGDLELYQQLLYDYYMLIDRKTEKIWECMATHDLRNYTVEVHALKSVSRIVGALDLSRSFLHLEELGNNEDLDAILAETPAVLNDYLAFKDRLASFVASYTASEDSTAKEISNDLLIELLEQIQMSIETFDLDSVDIYMKQLDSYEIPATYRKYIKKLNVLIIDVAMEEALDLLSQLLSSLRD